MSTTQVTVAGCPFVITPSEHLSSQELQSLERLDCDRAGSARPFTLHLSDKPLSISESAPIPSEGEPAAITVERDRIFVTHERFNGVIEPLAFEGFLYRQEGFEVCAMEIMLRTVISCRLPLEGGLLLHSAGVVVDDRAILFFGVSGAGKSTIAGMLEGMVLSDELIVVGGSEARGTGFWGSMTGGIPSLSAFPILALIDLGRGSSVELESLQPHHAFRRLLLATIVPPHPLLWSHALQVLQRLAHAPVFRLNWTASETNARRVNELLRGLPR